MQLAGKHVSMIGVGITAIAAIGGLLYYRSRSGSSGASADSGGGGSGFPYFQSAALPSSGAGGSPTYVTGTSTDMTETNNLIKSLASDQSKASLSSSFGSLLSGLISQQSAQLSNSTDVHQGEPVASRGFFKPDDKGGFEFGFGSMPILFSNPNTYINGSNVSQFLGLNSTGGGSQVPAVT